MPLAGSHQPRAAHSTKQLMVERDFENVKIMNVLASPIPGTRFRKPAIPPMAVAK
jgi:hypothetical protein